MRRGIGSVVLAMGLVIATVASAGAGSFHFRTAEFSLGSLTFNGIAVGLGNSDYSIELTGTALVTAKCENKGGTQADGRNDLLVTASNSVVVTTDSNGQTPVSVTVDDPTLDTIDVSPSAKQAGCPNGNWTVIDVTVADWVAASVVVTDLVTGTVVLNQQYTCGTVDGVFGCSAA